MRKLWLVVAAALITIACTDGAPSTSLAPTRATDASSIQGCTTDLNALLNLAATAFGAGSPNYNSVRGKIENMAHHLGNGNLAEARVRAHDIVRFTLDVNASKGLPGTQEQIAAFLSAVYCYVGLDWAITDPSSTALIFPSDSAQTIYGLGHTAGVSFPAFPVSEPTLVRVEPFDGLLNTKLDQYPGFIQITLLSENSLPLTGAATVAVCATGIPDAVADEDLRLGHGVNGNAGFEITPRPAAGDPTTPAVACEPSAPSLGLAARMWDAVSSVLMPRTLHARAAVLALRSGGVSGTVTEFSPFAPVDTKVEARGGVSGTVTEFSRSSGALLFADAFDAVDCAERSVGSGMPNECLPQVTIRTRRDGTLLASVPVDWAVPELALGRIAPRTGETCGAYARTAATVTSAVGTAGICWEILGAGSYVVSATPRNGGDAPDGVTFDVDGAGGTSATFALDVTPVTISIVSGDAQVASPGTTLPIAPTVQVLNVHGQPAAGVTIAWTALANSESSVAPPESVTGEDGRTSASWTIGAGYNELRAAVRHAEDVSSVTFTANGNSGTSSLLSCPVGGSGDPINDPSRPYAFYLPNPGMNHAMREVDLYFSATGKANRPTDYRVALITRLGGFNQPVHDSTVVTVELRGSASEAKQATFLLGTPVVGTNGRNAPAVTMELRLLNNPDNATVRFNTGPCPPGTNCKVAKACQATEVSSPMPFPLGTFYRKSVGIQVRGY